MQFYPLEKLINLYDGYSQLFRLDQQQLLLVQSGGELYAFESHCPHRGHPLQQGLIASDTIRCPLHNYHFHLQSGELLQSSEAPCRNLRVFEIAYEGRDVGVIL